MFSMIFLGSCGDKSYKVEYDTDVPNAEEVARAYLAAYEKFDINEMEKYSVHPFKECFGDIDSLTKSQEGVVNDRVPGVVAVSVPSIKTELKEEIVVSLNDIKELIAEDNRYIAQIDYNKIGKVCAYKVKENVDYNFSEVRVDYDEFGMTKEEYIKQHGESYEDYLMNNSWGGHNEYEIVLYLAKYKGEWKVIYEYLYTRRY